MSVSKCSHLIFATAVVVTLLPAITQAQSTDYRFEGNSTYTYVAGFPGAFLFDISGTFTLNENASSATATDVALILTPDPSNPIDLNVPLTSASGVAELLESDLFSIAISDPDQTVYQSTFSEVFPNDPLSITVDNLSANRLVTLSGAGSNDPFPIVVDGTSFRFSATAVAVPEPTGLTAYLLLAITFTAKRRRRT